MEAGRDRVAGGQEVLAEDVGDDDLLLALLEGVQLAVGVLLEQVEVRGVLLPAVVDGVAEEARAQVDVAEEEARGSRETNGWMPTRTETKS